MATVRFKGLCQGTQTKHSNKSGKDYQVTAFVDLDRFKTIEVFGDLGLLPDLAPREYVLDGEITGLSGVRVLAGESPAPAKK